MILKPSLTKTSLALIAAIVLCTCRQQVEQGESSLDTLQFMGRWELATAEVDGKSTDRLRSLYFVFLPDTSLQTNIFGSETNYKFSFEDGVILQFSNPQLNYELLEITDSTMSLRTELRGKQFTMYLGKSIPKRLRDPNPAE